MWNSIDRSVWCAHNCIFGGLNMCIKMTICVINHFGFHYDPIANRSFYITWNWNWNVGCSYVLLFSELGIQCSHDWKYTQTLPRHLHGFEKCWGVMGYLWMSLVPFIWSDSARHQSSRRSTMWFSWSASPRTEIMKQQTTFPPAEKKSGNKGGFFMGLG